MQPQLEIVLIEDEEDILELLEYHLAKAGYLVSGFLSTDNVEQFLEEESPALMIVDRNLPGVEGSEFVSYLRKKGYDIPVIFLTAKESDQALDEGYERGGDDYMTKPFRPAELLHRIKALLKRSGKLSSNSMIRHKSIILDMERQEVKVDGAPVALTMLEFRLLSTFMQHIDKPLTRDFLRDEVWGSEGDGINDNAVNVAINRLKNKIDPKGEKHYFEPVWGVGYKFG